MPASPLPPAASGPPRPPWAARVSRLRILLASAVAGATVWMVGGALDWMVVHFYLPPLPMVLADFAVAAAAGALVYKVLTDSRARHLAMMERLEVIGEMNHHIRNALQVITYHNRPGEDCDARNEKAMIQVDEAVTRIEWALREVLPPRK